MTAVPDTDLVVLDAFDRERGLRLARLVTLMFGGGIALVSLALLVAGLLSGSFATAVFTTVFGACLAGLACYALAWWLVGRKQLRLSATCLLLGFVGILAAIQATHGSSAGLDAIVVGIFGMYGILCALAGVLVDSRYMFASAVAANLLAGTLCFALPHASLGMAVIVWVIVSLEAWVAVLLTFGAQTLYTQTAQELGNLRVAIERAQRLDDLKNQFIRSVNHELRNPIMAWYSAAVTLQEGDAYLTPALRSKLAERSVDIGNRVLKLLRSILDVPLLDAQAKEFTPQAVSVRPIIDSALDLLDPQERGDQARDIHVAIAPGLAIWGEEVRLQQIFVNLFS
ncbi:MAG: HAMP domain-containing histidine kinase, partial [Ktedonobacterales bacterium]|nr:HAMP domain-containing histidine kinase [Ktedonobacterales bacterium]